ncbi:hypothetical protein ACIQ9I_10140 [Streptomyces sp. NPDC094461]
MVTRPGSAPPGSGLPGSGLPDGDQRYGDWPGCDRVRHAAPA